MRDRDGSTTALTSRNVQRHAWREAQVNASVAGNASEAMLGTSDPPGGFVAVELGFGFGEGPNILSTIRDLAPTNARAAKRLAATETRVRRETAAQRQKWAAMKLRDAQATRKSTAAAATI